MEGSAPDRNVTKYRNVGKELRTYTVSQPKGAKYLIYRDITAGALNLACKCVILNLTAFLCHLKGSKETTLVHTFRRAQTI
jgi:hypothetical protein